MARQFVLDTNLFIDAFRDPAENASLQQFHAAFAPFESLSGVVAHELRSGVRSKRDRRRLERHVLEPFERRGRLVTPLYGTWRTAADVLARLSALEHLPVNQFTRSFANDVLLAVSCRERGCTLVTRNLHDFKRIRRVLAFAFVPPWPSVSGR